MSIDINIRANEEVAPLIQLGFTQGEFAGKRFVGGMLPCSDPTCPCSNARLSLTDSGTGETLKFDMRLNESSLNVASEEAVLGSALERALREHADERFWKELIEVFTNLKRRQIREVDPDSIDVELPVGAFYGDMVGYYEVFPWAEPYEFAHEDMNWVLDDAYCLNPKCHCAKVGITFLEIIDAKRTGSAKRARQLRSLYDYKSAKLQPLEWSLNAPQCGALAKALRAEIPGFRELVATRHAQLQRIALRQWEKRQDALRPMQVKRETPKIGRNEPCPCGSGKKSKKCCGASSSFERVARLAGVLEEWVDWIRSSSGSALNKRRSFAETWSILTGTLRIWCNPEVHAYE